MPDNKHFWWPPPTVAEWCHWADAQPEPLWMIENFIPSDATLLISGPPKMGYKTWLVQVYAHVIATGQQIGPFKPHRQGPVLWVEQEGPTKQHRGRFDLLENGNLAMDWRSNPEIYFVHQQQVNIQQPEWRDRLCDFVSKKKIVFIIMDTYTKISGGINESDSADTGRTLSLYNDVRHAGPAATLALLHHLRKPTHLKNADKEMDIDDEIRGSSAIAGHYDVHHALRPQSTVPGHLKLTVRASDSAESYYSINWRIASENQSADLGIIKLASDGGAMVDDEMLSRCLLQLLPGVEYTEKMLADSWGVDRVLFQVITKKLLDAGSIISSGKGYKRQ